MRRHPQIPGSGVAPSVHGYSSQGDTLNPKPLKERTGSRELRAGLGLELSGFGGLQHV